MRYPIGRNSLQGEIHVTGFNLPEDEGVRMQSSLAHLEAATQELGKSRFTCDAVYHRGPGVYHLRFRLRVPDRTLAVPVKDVYLDSAWQQGMRELAEQVREYRKKTDEGKIKNIPGQAELNMPPLVPEDPQAGKLADAARQGDYRTFRTGLAGYEEWLRRRVGRWVQRYPQAEIQIGDGLLIGDIVEEVYLNAFESFLQRPSAVSLSDWLEGLIDPSLKAILRHPDEEHETASLARTVRAG
jgi:hypothetical protein